MVPPPGSDPGSPDFQSGAMTTSAKEANGTSSRFRTADPLGVNETLYPWAKDALFYSGQRIFSNEKSALFIFLANTQPRGIIKHSFVVDVVANQAF